MSKSFASWYSTPPGKVGHWFTEVLAAEWKGEIGQKCNSERPLILSHVVLPRTLSSRKAREIRANIDCRLDLWERVIHASLAGDALAEERAREGRVARSDIEDEDRLARRFHSGDNDCEGEGFSSTGGCLHKDWATDCRCPLGETLQHACTPYGKPHVCGLQGVQQGACWSFEYLYPIPEESQNWVPRSTGCPGIPITSQ